jgi:hypothetical protein
MSQWFHYISVFPVLGGLLLGLWIVMWRNARNIFTADQHSTKVLALDMSAGDSVLSSSKS